ncbi:MAG: hypothetical protein AB7N53_18820 [Candidatus Binatia bacterium]
MLTVPLTVYVSLLLVYDGSAWQFGSWQDRDGTVFPGPPNKDCAKRFVSPGQAIEHFRDLAWSLPAL